MSFDGGLQDTSEATLSLIETYEDIRGKCAGSYNFRHLVYIFIRFNLAVKEYKQGIRYGMGDNKVFRRRVQCRGRGSC